MREINLCNTDLRDLGRAKYMLNNCLKTISLKDCQIIWQQGMPSLSLALVLRDYLTQPFYLTYEKKQDSEDQNLPKVKNLKPEPQSDLSSLIPSH